MNTTVILQSFIVNIIESLLPTDDVLQSPAVPAQAEGAVDSDVFVGIGDEVGAAVEVFVGTGDGACVAVEVFVGIGDGVVVTVGIRVLVDAGVNVGSKGRPGAHPVNNGIMMSKPMIKICRFEFISLLLL